MEWGLPQYIISCGYLILHIFERIPKDNLHTGRIPFIGSSSTREACVKNLQFIGMDTPGWVFLRGIKVCR
jgi:hypothetical protein